jgi:N6-adenosine-specific RNA methylase IME4
MSIAVTAEPIVEVDIEAIQVGTRIRRDLGDIPALAESIERQGLINPITIDGGGNLICGERRLVACKQMGCKTILCRVMDLPDERQAEVDENRARKDFTPEEIGAWASENKALLQEEAAKRQVALAGTRPSTSPSGTVPQGQDIGKWSEQAAKVLGCSEKHVRRCADVYEAAQSNPKELGHLIKKMNEDGAKAAEKILKRHERKEEFKQREATWPDGKFNVLVVDPPWKYKSRQDDATHRAANPYPMLGIEELCGLPIADKSASDCVMWLWTTNAFLREAFELVDAWGFTYKTCLTWAKDRMGTGDWLRGQTEHCFLCVKGKPFVDLTNQTTLLHGPLREHSRKPDEFYEMVEKLCPGNKLDIFSREARPGWEAFGNETDKFQGQ